MTLHPYADQIKPGDTFQSRKHPGDLAVSRLTVLSVGDEKARIHIGSLVTKADRDFFGGFAPGVDKNASGEEKDWLLISLANPEYWRYLGRRSLSPQSGTALGAKGF